MLKPIPSSVHFPEQEERILRFWSEERIFHKTLEQRKESPEFVFYDGPPFATGLPHYGHLLAGTIKDIIPRYQTMRGHYVERRFGWDCHGLPVEYEMEQELKISGKREIEAMGIDVFNEKCRSIVLRYTREWREIVERTGRWVDFDHDYKTMEWPYMESIWWVFKALWEKDRIYEGHKILPYCPRCATPLSNFETNLGYQEVTDPAITVRFKIRGEPRTYLLAWTTTPWTLPSNLALAVGPDVTYAKVQDGEEVYYLAKDRVPVYYRKKGDYQLVEERPGKDLAGMSYKPLFPYFAEERARSNAFRVFTADFVSTEEGTGIVHIAPGFGDDDYLLGQREGLPAVCPVDDEGRFTEEVSDYQGREVKEADFDIVNQLKAEGKLVHRGRISHNYPHCWRCETPLIYRAISTWFVRVEQLRDRMLANNRKVHWVPEHIREGRFGKWLEHARDWAISRNRYWGTPLPVWRSEDGNEVVCIGSVAELEAATGQTVTDLHKHFVDRLEIPSRQGGAPLRRIPQVLDCWFESGAMPYAQSHYPFENKAHFEAHFPAHFIAEGLDQTRGWFYTLMVLSTALFDEPAFQNVIVNGMVLAEDGRKMSKRLKNYPDPVYILNTYGADALRLCLMNSPVVRAEDLCFSEEAVKTALRHLLLPWWNAYSFFLTYARTDSWTPRAHMVQSTNLLDRWIRSTLERLKQEVVDAMDGYQLQRAVRPLVQFIEELTNWYIRRSRRRFWKSTDDEDKEQAYHTLYAVLLELCKIAAPFVPFISEAIYRNLRADQMPESVHLCDYPLSDGSRREHELEKQMDAVIAAVGMGRTLRAEYNLKVRQPLMGLHVVSRDQQLLEDIEGLKDVVAEELNVRHVWFSQDDAQLASLVAKPNFRQLGPRLGNQVKPVADRIATLAPDALQALVNGKGIELEVNGDHVRLEPQDVIIEREPKPGLAVKSEGALVVALEVDLTQELVREGLAREFVNKVQQMRKAAQLDVAQRIYLSVAGDEDVREAVAEYADYIKNETLALDCRLTERPDTTAESWDLNGHPCAIRVETA